MNTTLAVLGLSGGELVLVLVVILVLFGAKRIPEFAKGLGKGINEFKNESRDCINNSIDMLHRVCEETGSCVCGQARVEYVREATYGDEELMVGERLSSVTRY